MKNVKLIALTSLCGKYLMPHDAGTPFEVDEKQAEVMVNAGDAKYDDSEKESKAKASKATPAAETATDKAAATAEKS